MFRSFVLSVALASPLLIGCSSEIQKAYTEAASKEIELNDKFAANQLEFHLATIKNDQEAQTRLLGESQSMIESMKLVQTRLTALRPKTPDPLKFVEYNEKVEALSKRIDEIQLESKEAIRKKDEQAIRRLNDEERKATNEMSEASELKARYKPK
jgi:outer membrane murein-binding lipoprotein Lpp